MRPRPITQVTPRAQTAQRQPVQRKDGYYLAFDYLIDLPSLDRIPHATWEPLIDHATPQQAFSRKLSGNG